MDIYQIEIIDPKAKKLLDDLAKMDLIKIQRLGMEAPGSRRTKGPNRGGGQKQTPTGQREAIMALAGSWSAMSEADFQEYLAEAKRTRGEMFDLEVRL
jgi:hypothetical protein